MGDLRVSHCVPFIRSDRGCFGAALGFKTEKNENVLRNYGFEEAFDLQGGGATLNSESKITAGREGSREGG